VELAAKITDKVVPGLVFTSFQYPDVPINKLTNPVTCPIAKIPEYKVCAVKVEKAG
jgi:predicted molibdopterin-dependent oxidoreductase YjgC